MNCVEALHLEPLYVSGDLDPKTMAEIDLHLGVCANCALHWKERDRLDELVREAVNGKEVDAAAVIERARRQMRLSPQKAMAWKYAAAAASLVFALAATIILLRPSPREPALYSLAAEDHRVEVIDHAPREWIRGAGRIEQVLQQKVAVAGLVQTLEPDGYHIERAMVCPLANRQYVHLIYSNGAREVSFFIRQKEGEQLAGEVVDHVNGIPVHTSRAKGLEIAGFQSAQLTILVVGSLPRDETVHFAVHAASGV
jgi:anti-sigma factor RsiW